MNPETVKQQIEELEEKGWQADDTPRAVEKRYQFPHFSETLNFLIEVGSAVDRTGASPSIHIDSGTQVTVRVGQEASPTLTEPEIRLAQALPA